MPLSIVITEAGRIALVNAENTGTAPVEITEIGLSETAIVPSAADVALADEFKRVAGISGTVVSDDTIHVSMFDDSADEYALHSFALYLDDGTLFGIYGQVDPVLEKTTQSIAGLSIDVTFADVDAASITFGDATFVNPPASTEQMGVVELATLPEAQTGTDPTRALVPATAKGALLAWLLAQDGSGSGIDADLLDGLDATGFLRVIDPLAYGENGNGWWEKRANGLIEQGGRVTNHTEAEATFTITFPYPFANLTQVRNIQATAIINDGQPTGPFTYQIRNTSISATGFQISLRSNGQPFHTDGFYWRAIGRLV